MENKSLIPIEQLCSHYHIEVSFLYSLSEFGLIELTRVDETVYVYTDQMSDLEKMIRLHVDLNINLEGIDAIFHLLQKVDGLHNELRAIKNQLHFPDPNDNS